MNIIQASAVLAGIAALISCGVSPTAKGDAEEPSTHDESGLYTGTISQAISLISTLRNESHRSTVESADLLVAANRELDACMLNLSSTPFRSHIKRQLENSETEDREFWKLVLARSQDVPGEFIQQCLISDNVDLWGWALCREDSYLVNSEEETGGNTAFDGDAANQMAYEIVQRLQIPEETLSQYKDEYQEAYEFEFLPRLEHLWNYIPDSDIHLTDINNDGVSEIAIATSFPDGWSGRDFLAVLSPESKQGGWELSYFLCLDEESERLSDAESIDLDNDGNDEWVVSTHSIGNEVEESIYIFDLGKTATQLVPSRLWAKHIRFVEHPYQKKTYIVTQNRVNPMTSGGTAIRWCASLCMSNAIHEFQNGKPHVIGNALSS